MEGAEADVPRKESSNNSTQMAEGHCTRAAGHRAPTHRPSPRAGPSPLTVSTNLKKRGGEGVEHFGGRGGDLWGGGGGPPPPPFPQEQLPLPLDDSRGVKTRQIQGRGFEVALLSS